MSERSGKSSKVNLVTPTVPTVSWDFNRPAKPGEVLQSEPNIMIHAFHGRAWDQRGTQGTGRSPVPRRQMFKPKIPSI